MAGVIYKKNNPDFMQKLLWGNTKSKLHAKIIMHYYQSTVRALLWGITNANNSITIDKNAFCIMEMTPLFRFLLQLYNCLICSQNGWHLMTTGWIHHDFYQTVRVPRPKEVHVGRHGWHRRHRNHHENNPAPMPWGEGVFIVAKKNGLKSRKWLIV